MNFLSSTKEAAATGGALLAKYAWWKLSHPDGTFEDMTGGAAMEFGCVAKLQKENSIKLASTTMRGRGPSYIVFLRHKPPPMRHFYDSSPWSIDIQRVRPKPACALSDAHIKCLVWGEDALAYIHFIPTGLFNLHLVVPD